MLQHDSLAFFLGDPCYSTTTCIQGIVGHSSFSDPFMDPFSLAVGISGIVALTAQTLKLTRTYFHGVRTSSKAAASLAKELETLQSTLARLEEFLRSEDAKRHTFSGTSVLVSSTGACQSKLKLLYAKLNAVGSSRLSRALWPLNEKEHQQSVGELRSFSQWIQFALTIDGW